MLNKLKLRFLNICQLYLSLLKIIHRTIYKKEYRCAYINTRYSHCYKTIRVEYRRKKYPSQRSIKVVIPGNLMRINLMLIYNDNIKYTQHILT